MDRHTQMPQSITCAVQACLANAKPLSWPLRTADGLKENNDKATGEFDNPWAATLKEAEGMARDAAHRIQVEFPGWSVSSDSLWGDPAKMLLKIIDVWQPELIVVGSHGRSVPTRMILVRDRGLTEV